MIICSPQFLFEFYAKEETSSPLHRSSLAARTFASATKLKDENTTRAHQTTSASILLQFHTFKSFFLVATSRSSLTFTPVTMTSLWRGTRGEMRWTCWCVRRKRCQRWRGIKNSKKTLWNWSCCECQVSLFLVSFHASVQITSYYFLNKTVACFPSHHVYRPSSFAFDKLTHTCKLVFLHKEDWQIWVN